MKAKDKPLVAILEVPHIPITDPESKLESKVLGDAVYVKHFVVYDEKDYPTEVLEADALILWHDVHISANTIAKLRNCKVIARNGVGYELVDTKAARTRGIPVCNVPDYGTEEVADHAIALSLALCRQLFPLVEESKRLSGEIPVRNKLRRLNTLNFCIVGLGAIGTSTALKAKALGFKVSFYDPYAIEGAHKAIGIQRMETLDECLAIADILSIHCPLTPQTRHMIAERELALMKPSAFVVNTSRGAIVKKSAILAALASGGISGAGLDVVEDEPLKTEEEARTPNLLVTPHAGFCSAESMEEMRKATATHALRAIQGLPLKNVVNK